MSGTATAGAYIRLAHPERTFNLGDSVTFDTYAPGLNGGEYPMVVVRCYQGGEVTYAQLDYPDAVFVLGGGSSAWKSAGMTGTTCPAPRRGTALGMYSLIATGAPAGS